MNESRRSVPFSITLLTLMALIVLRSPRRCYGWAGGRRSSRTASVGQRMASLETAVEDPGSGLRVVAAVGATLAESPSFAPDRGPDADQELQAVRGAARPVSRCRVLSV